MLHRMLFLLVVLAALLVSGSAAQAQSQFDEMLEQLGKKPIPQVVPPSTPPPCAQRAQFIYHLNKNYGEAPRAMGLTDNGAVLEVLVSENGTWTIIVTVPSGVTCGIAIGHRWENNLARDAQDSGPPV